MVVSNQKGVLYLVATPIGHLDDLTVRAAAVLSQVDLIAAEDTRHSRRLLQHYGIHTPIQSLHQHNEAAKAAALIGRLQQGESVALISDAGTPLISDPGYPLVLAAREAGIQVSPVPGPCALVAALSASGLPASRFYFEGFLPRTASARQQVFRAHQADQGTLVFYESSHRIQACLQDLVAVYGAEHPIALARELTKQHETIVSGSAEEISHQVECDPNMRKGEFVVMVSAPAASMDADATELDALLLTLLSECSVRTATNLAAKLTGAPKKQVYQQALALKSLSAETENS